jgi:hypothetical protein
VSKRNGFFRWHRAVILGAVAALVLVLPAAAGGATVTRGAFQKFAAGTLDVSGHAVMVRTADGRTFVFVHVRGLAPNTAYASHVHDQACNDGLADGHYQHAGTAVNDDNEIWPSFTTDAAGIGNGNARNDWTARTEARSVVVHTVDASGTPILKIACADLE